jgi:uncharacterized protein (DUF427 family)
MGGERIPLQPGQESVWDYPRPPRVEPSQRHIQVVFNGVVIADTQRAWRVLETSHPPVYYLPPEDVQTQYLTPSKENSYCEWKGSAGYYTLTVGERTVSKAAWFYADPTPAFLPLRDYVAFYPGKMDTCTIDGEIVQAQPGDFYGGWITREIVGPFKGAAGTWGW